MNKSALPRLRGALAFGTTMAVAGIGGAIADAVGLVGGWLTGALAAVLLAGWAGLPLAMPMTMRSVALAFAGLTTGAMITPDVFSEAARLAATMGGLLLSTVAILGASYLVHRSIGRSAAPTAFYSSWPGNTLLAFAGAETSAADLLGRWLVKGGDTVWQDGPVTRAVRQGAVLYLDEIAEAREDVIVVLHPLSDHRRELHLDRRDETLAAPPSFTLVVSFNPGYRKALKELKPSTRQRFVALQFDYPQAEIEAEVVAREAGIEGAIARRLVTVAHKLRALDELGLAETASTRLLVNTAALLREGLPPRVACRHGIVDPLTDDPAVAAAMQDVVDLAF